MSAVKKCLCVDCGKSSRGKYRCTPCKKIFDDRQRNPELYTPVSVESPLRYNKLIKNDHVRNAKILYGDMARNG